MIMEIFRDLELYNECEEVSWKRTTLDQAKF